MRLNRDANPSREGIAREFHANGFFGRMRDTDFSAEDGQRVLTWIRDLDPKALTPSARKEVVIALHDIPFAMRSWLPGCVEMGADRGTIGKMILDFRKAIGVKIVELLEPGGSRDEPRVQDSRVKTSQPEIPPPEERTFRPRIRRAEVPAYLLLRHGMNSSVTTLAKFAVVGGGPAMQYNGRIPLYRTEDLDEWANRRLSKAVRSTSERR